MQRCWVPGTTTLEEIYIRQPVDGQLNSWADAATGIGVSLHDRVFYLGAFKLGDMRRWRADDAEYAELVQDRGEVVRQLEQPWRFGPLPPPIIVARLVDGDVWGIDGYHRFNTALRVGVEAIHAWVAFESASP